jgi:hypothetical protein
MSETVSQYFFGAMGVAAAIIFTSSSHDSIRESCAAAHKVVGAALFPLFVFLFFAGSFAGLKVLLLLIQSTNR